MILKKSNFKNQFYKKTSSKCRRFVRDSAESADLVREEAFRFLREAPNKGALDRYGL